MSWERGNVPDQPDDLAYDPYSDHKHQHQHHQQYAADQSRRPSDPYNFSDRLSDRPLTARPTGKRSEGTSVANPAATAPRFRHAGMAGMLDIDRSHPRRERTFAGGECVVCEEPLEHTLRGERILQLSCAHVSHEACFYEFIRESDSQSCPSCGAPLGLDSSRGGNVLDIEKLSTIVRSLVVNNNDHHQRQTDSRSNQTTPVPWDPSQGEAPGYNQDADYDAAYHARKESNGTARTSGEASGAGSGLSQMSMRRPTHDSHSVSEAGSHRSGRVKNPIPNPKVTIKSEFPTLARSKEQQNLTCLVTVEVPEGKWQPDMEDLRSMRPRLSQTVERTHRQSASQASNKLPERQAAPKAVLPDGGESAEELERVTEDLYSRVDNWHGLDFSRFGALLLHDTVRVGKDRLSWQELECYLFAEMLICVKEKRNQQPPPGWDGNPATAPRPRCVLKGSIMIKKHLSQIETSSEASNILTLNLTVPELPTFHLFFRTQRQLEVWRDAFIALNNNDALEKTSEYDQDISEPDEEESRQTNTASVDYYSRDAHASYQTQPTEYSDTRGGSQAPRLPISLHVPMDVVLVIPLSSSMHSLKITLLRDLLKFVIQSLGGRDRLGLVTFGSSSGSVSVVPMTNKAWPGWGKVTDSIRSTGAKSARADPVDGAKVAMDILMDRRSNNPLSSIIIVSDSSASETENIDAVVSRAEAAKVSIYTFGLGLTHKPDTMIELSTRTKAAYTYVKDWMMIRECVAGCIGSLQSISHQNVVLKLKLPEGSPGKIMKISGALLTTRRQSGREAEAALGDFRFGEKRDVLVQLVIASDTVPSDSQADPWDNIVSGLQDLGNTSDPDDDRSSSVEEVPIIQASLSFGDVLRDGATQNSPRPSLLTITMLPPEPKSKTSKPGVPPIPPHTSIVQRRMELLASDMLTRALTLVSKGKHEQAHATLTSTRSILKGLGKGGLPPVPSQASQRGGADGAQGSSISGRSTGASEAATDRKGSPPPPPAGVPASSPVDPTIMAALDAELEAALEWINHPAVFGRDSRKAVLEKIGVVSSQRAYTFRTGLETLYASKIPGIRMLYDEARNWPEAVDEALAEEQ